MYFTSILLQHAASHGLDSDEMLQADVMRFMAIIGFCLIAIFAVFKQAAQTTALPEQHTTHSVERALPSAALPSTPRQPSVDFIVRVDAPTDIRKVASDQASQSAVARVSVNEPIKDRLSGDEVGHVEEAEKSHVSANLVNAIAALPKANSRADASNALPPKNVTAKRSQYEQTQRVNTAEKSLSLRLDSDRTLSKLLGQNKLQVYVVYGRYSWQFVMKDADMTRPLRLQPVVRPQQIYQMQTQTVPPEFSEQLQYWLTQQGLTVEATNLTWGLQLNSDLRQQLEQKIHAYQYGELIIDQDGKIHVANGMAAPD